MNSELKQTLTEFIDSFEELFDRDWNYTKQCLGMLEETEGQKRNAIESGLDTIFYISPSGTFLNPKVEDETEDWGNRGKLLEQYRKLKLLLNSFQT